MGMEIVRCADISPGPRRGAYRQHDVEPLAESIREHGVLRPVLLREAEDGYVIVHGVRRWLAAKMVGIEAIPAFLVHNTLHDDTALADADTADAY